jgi:hypothetical protein
MSQNANVFKVFNSSFQEQIPNELITLIRQQIEMKKIIKK